MPDDHEAWVAQIDAWYQKGCRAAGFYRDGRPIEYLTSRLSTEVITREYRSDYPEDVLAQTWWVRGYEATQTELYCRYLMKVIGEVQDLVEGI